jgi:TonB family protein
VVADRPTSPRSALRTLGVARRRDGVSWRDGVGLLLAALLCNGVGLYTTSVALARALEPKPFPKREKVVEFNLVPGNSMEPSSDLRPKQDGLETGDASKPETRPRDAVPTTKTEPGPARDKTKVADGLPDDGDEPDYGDDSLVEASDGTIDTDSGAPGRPDPLAKLGGSTSMLDQTFGRPVANDRMRDVDEGVDNILASKRHLFGSFFKRLTERVSEQWQPAKVHSAADPKGTRFGDKQRTTVLMVRLDDTGHILKVEVERESGAPHLDEEAERALRAAAPFPNMPEGLADEHGHVDFRFGFILDFNGGSRIFRYQ